MPKKRFLWLFRAACIDGENRLKQRASKTKKNIVSKKTYSLTEGELYGQKNRSNVAIVEMQSSDCSVNDVFNFVIFGQLIDFSSVNISACVNGIHKIYENIGDEADLKVSVISKEESNNLTTEQKREIQKLPIRVMKPGDSIIVSKQSKSVMFFAFEYPSFETIKEGFLSEADAYMLKIANDRHVDYVIAYGVSTGNLTKACLDAEKQYEKSLADGGCNYIVSSNKNELCKNRYDANSDEEKWVKIASTGSIFGIKDREGFKENQLRPGVVIKTNLHFLKGGNNVVDSTEYLPYYVREKDGIGNDMQLIDYRDELQLKDEGIRRTLDYIDSNMGAVKYVGSAFTVREICDLLGEELPAAYSYLGDIPVGKVCTRASEVAQGDLLFILEQYKFTNDDDVRPWILRKRIASVSMNKGAVFVISHRALPMSIPHIVVKNCREAHIKICREIRKKYNIKIAGVTGSVGKTSTKDMLFDVLRQKYNTHRSVRNANAQVNIGMHLQEIKGTNEFLVQEIDGSRPGSASRHSRMLLPEVCAITNIGWAHIGNFGTQEKLLEAKLGVVDGMTDGGTLVVNWDDPLLRKIDKEYLQITPNLKNIEKKILEKIKNIQVLSYAIENIKADYYATEIEENEGQTVFYIVHGDKRVRTHLNVIGKYNVLNAVCCYAIGRMYNMSDDEIVKGLSDFTTSGVRQNFISVGGYKLFVDCFNSSPPSVESSLSVLDSIECDRRKIAIIGDITGADNLAENVHKRVGDIINKHKPDIVICYGKYSKIVFDKIKNKFQNSFYFTDKNKLNEFLKYKTGVGDVILFKGSSKMNLYERIDENYGTMLSDQVYIDDNKFRKLKRGGIQYNIYRTYGTVVKGCQKAGTPKIAKSIWGLPVYNIGDKAFYGRSDIEGIVIHDGIRHIGRSCFEESGIREVNLPKTVKFIGERAFCKCSDLKKIDLPSGIIHIGAEAFEGCSSLKMITLPSSVTEIGKDVFKECDNLTIFCQSGSYGEKYCIDKQLNFISLK